MEQKKTAWPWVRIISAVFVGALLFATILPSIGCIYKPAHNQFTKGMWHVGPYLVYPDILFYIAYMPLAVGFVIVGAMRGKKFEAAGWVMPGFVFLAVLFG